MIRLLADENIARSVLEALREKGCRVIDVKEELWYGKSDQFLLNYAAREGLIILTHDKDFLLQRDVSVILLRFYRQQPQEVIQSIVPFFHSSIVQKKLRKKVIVVLTEQGAEFNYI